jgi:hypothetical protein
LFTFVSPPYNLAGTLAQRRHYALRPQLICIRASGPTEVAARINKSELQTEQTRGPSIHYNGCEQITTRAVDRPLSHVVLRHYCLCVNPLDVERLYVHGLGVQAASERRPRASDWRHDQIANKQHQVQVKCALIRLSVQAWSSTGYKTQVGLVQSYSVKLCAELYHLRTPHDFWFRQAHCDLGWQSCIFRHRPQDPTQSQQTHKRHLRPGSGAPRSIHRFHSRNNSDRRRNQRAESMLARRQLRRILPNVWLQLWVEHGHRVHQTRGQTTITSQAVFPACFEYSDLWIKQHDARTKDYDRCHLLDPWEQQIPFYQPREAVECREPNVNRTRQQKVNAKSCDQIYAKQTELCECARLTLKVEGANGKSRN